MIKRKRLASLGVAHGEQMRAAQDACEIASQRFDMDSVALAEMVVKVLAEPGRFSDDELWGPLARLVLEDARQTDAPDDETAQAHHSSPRTPRRQPAPWKQWGADLDTNAVQQMTHAAALPVALRGALMPDAHMGYGLPIGGVLATDNAIIPYAVGMDIACRMKLTVLDLPVSTLADDRHRLRDALCRETNFGVGSAYRGSQRLDHPVMDDNWRVSPVTISNKDKAWAQLGTSGSGNHFAEFGVLSLAADDLGLPAGEYLALLTHSGSRGTGGEVATHYSKLAASQHPELPKEQSHLAWFDLDSHAGSEYFGAMELMGRYAKANHQLIHERIVRHLGATAIAGVENHHNFAWVEEHFDRRVVVHRKGATPAATGLLAVIPGSMTAPGYVVRGKGCELSLNSAAHGAGRALSRKAAFREFTWEQLHAHLARCDVELISAGLDECPMAYKDIDTVMAAQRDLVDIVARFTPKLVRMAKSESRRRR
jgi:tRNA-splicing ligase RtcB